MNRILYDEQGEIQAIVVPGQDIDAVRSNWADKNLQVLEVDPSIELIGKYKNYLYRINTETKELINAI